MTIPLPQICDPPNEGPLMSVATLNDSSTFFKVEVSAIHSSLLAYTAYEICGDKKCIKMLYTIYKLCKKISFLFFVVVKKGKTCNTQNE